MYLSLLNEKQKDLCIGLVINLASVDGNFSEDERVMIDGYCYEMGITYDYTKEVDSPQEIVEKLCEISNKKEKQIIVFEAVGLAMADNEFHDNERIMIGNMAEKFGLESSFVAQCEKLILDYMEIQNNMNKLVINV